MVFIKIQKLVIDDNGNVKSGSAAVVESVYTQAGRSHSKHVQKEKLGKVVWLSEDRRKGIFLSPTRGLVEYDADEDDFKEVLADDDRIHGTIAYTEPQIHTEFGSVYLVLEFLKSCGMMSILRKTFTNDLEYQRTLVHQIYALSKDGSRIRCDMFFEGTSCIHLFPSLSARSFYSDTPYFEMMGNDKNKVDYFKRFVGDMRSRYEGFGECCIMDTTPLPNDINSPFNALCSHGLKGTDVQMRLILVLDAVTGFIVWYDVIPGNILDLLTTGALLDGVQETLKITISKLVLDAGYASEALINAHHIGSGKKVLVRMPNRKGYPFMQLYESVKDLIDKGDHAFIREDHLYFGIRKEVTVFGKPEYAYVYVDKFNAVVRSTEYMREHPLEYDALTSGEKRWKSYEYGYFVLLSNLYDTPERILNRYFGRTDIEMVFKTSKEYIGLLPLCKWTDTTIRGKILSDIISTQVLLEIRGVRDDSKKSISEIIQSTKTLMSLYSRGEFYLDPLQKQTKESYQQLGIEQPKGRISLEYLKERYELE